MLYGIIIAAIGIITYICWTFWILENEPDKLGFALTPYFGIFMIWRCVKVYHPAMVAGGRESESAIWLCIFIVILATSAWPLIVGGLWYKLIAHSRVWIENAETNATPPKKQTHLVENEEELPDWVKKHPKYMKEWKEGRFYLIKCPKCKDIFPLRNTICTECNSKIILSPKALELHRKGF